KRPTTAHRRLIAHAPLAGSDRLCPIPSSLDFGFGIARRPPKDRPENLAIALVGFGRACGAGRAPLRRRSLGRATRRPHRRRPNPIVNGHCWYLGGECSTDDGLRRAVAERAERGCDVVKVMVSGGGLTPTTPMWKSQFSRAQLQSIVDDAHGRGMPVAAHCHG